MTTHDLRMMMLSIDGVLSQYSATPTDLMAVAQAIATSAIGDLTNKMFNGPLELCSLATNGTQECSMVNGQCSMVNGQSTASLHRFADLAADQIRAALHQRIDEGPKPDW